MSLILRLSFCLCRDAKGVVRTKQESKWKQQLKEWRENNPISNGDLRPQVHAEFLTHTLLSPVAFYSVKTRYDESDHLLIRASRMVTDKVEDLWSGAMTQSDMAEALAEIHKIDPSFNKEEFVQQCKYEIIPSVLEAFMQNNQEVLKDWCHEGVSGDKDRIDDLLSYVTGFQCPVSCDEAAT